MIKINKRTKKIIENLVKASFDKDGHLVEKNVMSCVGALKHLPSLVVILALKIYLRGIKNEAGKRLLKIDTAVPLSQVEIKRVVKAMELHYPVSDVSVCVNPSLLGGLRVKIGDVVYDDSVSRKILQVGEAING